jgi:hypothetical protein
MLLRNNRLGAADTASYRLWACTANKQVTKILDPVSCSTIARGMEILATSVVADIRMTTAVNTVLTSKYFSSKSSVRTNSE